jgi:hypothetical protein
MTTLLLSLLMAADWQSLFDGKTFNGWELRPKDLPPLWTIEDGCIKTLRLPLSVTEDEWRAKTPAERRSYQSDILTKTKYRDFELEFEFKVAPRGNSGVKYRLQGIRRTKPGVQPPGGPQDSFISNDYASAPSFMTVGFEYQVADDETTPDAQRGGRWSAAALYDLLEPKKSRPVTADVWHRGRIVAQGPHVEHWVDNEKVVDGNVTSAEFKAVLQERHDAQRSSPGDQFRREQNSEAFAKDPMRESPIALQHHGTNVLFRNIRIKRLD